jgi:hypothetical protein
MGHHHVPSTAAPGREAEAAAVRGSATVEHVALAALIALLVIAGISALASNPRSTAGRELASAIGRKLACAPRLPDPCHRNPLALAYGFPLGKLVRALAPPPQAVSGLVPVDFRRCRQRSCSTGAENGLTASGRKVTEFTAVDDRRHSEGLVRVTYWLYRPGLGWEEIVREGGAADVAAADALRLHVTDDPVLVPLETLVGRDHYEFPAAEEPPWRWRVPGVYPG